MAPVEHSHQMAPVVLPPPPRYGVHLCYFEQGLFIFSSLGKFTFSPMCHAPGSWRLQIPWWVAKKIMPHKFIFYFFQFTFDIFLIYLDTVIIITIHKDAYIVFTHTKYQFIATKGTKVTNYKWHECNANSVTKKSPLFNCLPRLQVPYKTISMGMYTDAFVSKYQINTVVHSMNKYASVSWVTLSVVAVEPVNDNVELSCRRRPCRVLGAGGQFELSQCHHHCQSSHSHSQSMKNYYSHYHCQHSTDKATIKPVTPRNAVQMYVDWAPPFWRLCFDRRTRSGSPQ